MQQFYALDPTSQRTEIPKLSHLLPVKIIFHNKCKICFLFAKNPFSPHIAPEAIYFRIWLVKKKKKHNYSWNEVSSSHAVKLKNKPVQEKEENQEKENENVVLGQTCNPSQERRGI